MEYMIANEFPGERKSSLSLQTWGPDSPVMNIEVSFFKGKTIEA
jgi:hypothetical protein